MKYSAGYSSTSCFADVTNGFFTGASVNTGSSSTPSGATLATSKFVVRTSNGTSSDERLHITSAGHSYHGGSVGIQTNNIDGANISNPVGAGHSLVGLYIGDGSLMFSSALSRSGGYYISTDINALNAGPVTLNTNMKLDGTWVIV